jgi:hypothetical protein
MLLMPRLKTVSILALLVLTSCRSMLWGAPPPPPTGGAPTLVVILPPSSTPLPTATVPPTSSPAPQPLPLLWISPSVPQPLREVAQGLGIPLAPDQASANLYIGIAQTLPGAERVSSWIYALVAPFPTVPDGVTSDELRAYWGGSAVGPFAGRPLLMDASTLETFSSLWGQPAEGSVKMIPSDQLLETAWKERPSWGIIPFEALEPRWKVLTVDGQSPIHKSFDPGAYALTVMYRLTCTTPCPVSELPAFETTNRDPEKLATVILTGVTALVRATARTMDVKGITYPGEVIRDMLREADVLHISNEVSFYAGCPEPDPNQSKQIFCSRPRYIQLLTDIGTDVVELSGDHFVDYEQEGMLETLALYDQYGIPYYGGGINLKEGRKPYLTEVNGNKIMFIGCNAKDIYAKASDTLAGAVLCDFEYMTEQIRMYRAEGYLPIATFQYHEFEYAAAKDKQRADFRAMADAGAVIVSGSQAHVPQVMEFYGDAFIHYGLGNLFFDQMKIDGPKTKQREFIDRHVFYNGRYISVELITTFLEDFSRPRYMTPQERTQFLTDYFTWSGWPSP